MVISLLASVTTFPEQFYFRRSYFCPLLQSKYSTVTFSEEPFPQIRCLFLRSSFYRTVTSSQQLFFQNSYLFRVKLLPSSHFFRVSSYLGQLLVGTATFSAEELLSIKRPTKDLRYFQKTFLSIAVSFSQQNFSEEILFYSYASFPHLLFLFFSL